MVKLWGGGAVVRWGGGAVGRWGGGAVRESSRAESSLGVVRALNGGEMEMVTLNPPDSEHLKLIKFI